MPTIHQIADVLKRPKILVGEMVWVPKLNRDAPLWKTFEAAVKFCDDELTPEGLKVRGEWKPPGGRYPVKWSFGFFIETDRVYAIDVHALQKHKNEVGEGRPYFKQTISGHHEHSWSDDGGLGYVEPISLDESKGDQIWTRFAQGSGIVQSTFCHPEGKQTSLLL